MKVLLDAAIILVIVMSSIHGEQVNLVTPLKHNQNYYCDESVITCTGSGGSILWTAPPAINKPSPFIATSPLNVSRYFGDVTIVLTSVTPGPPSMCTTQMTLSNISEVNVTCQTDIPGSLSTLQLIRSVVPTQVGNHLLALGSESTLRSTWTAPHGNYDLSHYVVNVYLDNHAVISEMNTEMPYFVYAPPQSGEVRVTVSAVTKCGQVGESSSTKTITNIVVNNKGKSVVAKLSAVIGIFLLTVSILY